MHPELVAEQDYVDRAYAFLEAARDRARELTGMVQVGRGGTNQARFEREAIWDAVAARLDRLEMGDAALVFGRIDQEADGTTGGGRYYIGRVGVWDDDQEPVVVDWRAPVAEAFYRATGRMPMGLERRRHFVSRGRELLAIEDELFGDVERFRDGDGLRGEGALIAALETARTGRLGDIVGTIQAEQDLVIRAPMPGVLAVQGGPGTGKTVVALHRAAYLLYTNRFPLEGQGVLVVGPNRLFLAYIEQVLPSLGEAGIELATLSDVVGGVRVDDRHDAESVSRLKGDLRMVRFVARAARTRQRSLRRDLRVGYGVQWLRITVEETERIVAEARRRFRTHNAARRYVEQEFFSTLAESARADLDPGAVRERLRGELPVREALEWMWPVLTPAQLLNDLFGSRALLRAADSSLPGGAGAAAGPSGAGRRPHLRPHRRGRGPGPLTDGTAHARAAVPERFDDRGGRHRPGHGRLGPRRLGEHPRPPARQAAVAAARADRGLPHPRSAHGPRRPGAGRGRPRPHAAGGGSG